MTKREKLSRMEMPELLQDRVETSAHYYENAIALMNRGEYRKASELLWGATTQMIKALSQVEGTEIRSHKQFRSYVHDKLSYADPKLMSQFRDIESLHNHFYDATLERDEVEQISATVRQFIERLRELLYSRLKKEGQTGNTTL